jgi:hypothetical protein
MEKWCSMLKSVHPAHKTNHISPAFPPDRQYSKAVLPLQPALLMSSLKTYKHVQARVKI